jgi:hypothetical protein
VYSQCVQVVLVSARIGVHAWSVSGLAAVMVFSFSLGGLTGFEGASEEVEVAGIALTVVLKNGGYLSLITGWLHVFKLYRDLSMSTNDRIFNLKLEVLRLQASSRVSTDSV